MAGGVRATEGRMLPDEACAGELEREEGGACLSEGEEGGADIVEAAGEHELSGLRDAARRAFGFDDEDGHARSGEVSRRCEAVGPGSDHDRVRHETISITGSRPARRAETDDASTPRRLDWLSLAR